MYNIIQGVKQCKTLEEAISFLTKYDNEHCISTWSIEDIRSISPKITDEQAIEVLHTVERKLDPEFGTSWDTLEYWVSELGYGEDDL